MDVVRAIAQTAREVVARGDFPLVLAGVCSSSLGTVAGLGTPPGLGVVWFDAHGDFNTPETTPTGFFDGMPLAMLTGTGWSALRAGVENLRPLDEANVVLVGARDLDPPEQERLEHSGVRCVRPGEPLEPALSALAARVHDVYVHVDLDVLDPSEGQANRYRSENGLTADEVASAIGEVARRFTIRAAALTAYEPVYDTGGTVPGAATLIAKQIVGAGVTA
jgi:arginase